MLIIKAATALKETGVFCAAASPKIFMGLIVFEKLDPPGKNPGPAPAAQQVCQDQSVLLSIANLKICFRIASFYFVESAFRKLGPSQLP